MSYYVNYDTTYLIAEVSSFPSNKLNHSKQFDSHDDAIHYCTIIDSYFSTINSFRKSMVMSMQLTLSNYKGIDLT